MYISVNFLFFSIVLSCNELLQSFKDTQIIIFTQIFQIAKTTYNLHLLSIQENLNQSFTELYTATERRNCTSMKQNMFAMYCEKQGLELYSTSLGCVCCHLCQQKRIENKLTEPLGGCIGKRRSGRLRRRFLIFILQASFPVML